MYIVYIMIVCSIDAQTMAKKIKYLSHCLCQFRVHILTSNLRPSDLYAIFFVFQIYLDGIPSQDQNLEHFLNLHVS
jgi:hypothetical protein